MGSKSTRLAATLATCILCLALGGAAGVGGMYLLGYRFRPQPPRERNLAELMGGPSALPPGIMPPGGMVTMPSPDGAPKAAGAGGGRGPAAKNQLAALVSKLDQLTAKPLAVTLTDEQRAQLAAQLVGLAEMDELGEGEAGKRLDAILKVVEGQRAMLEAAGYRWPGDGFQRPEDVPNPFATQEQGERLQALQGRLAAKKTP